MARAALLVALVACKSSSPAAEPLELPIASTGVAMTSIKAPGLLFISATGGYSMAAIPMPWDGSLGMARTPVASPGDALWKFDGLVDDSKLRHAQLVERARLHRSDDEYLQRGELEGGARVVALSEIMEAPLVIASPRAPAHALFEVVKRSGALLGVSLGDHLGVLDLAFHQPNHPPERDGPGWLELSYDADTLTILDVRTGTPHVLGLSTGVLDTAAFNAIVAELHGAEAADILVGKQLTVQQVVDWVEALHAAGWATISLVESSVDVEARRTAALVARGPRIMIGQPNANGDLDKAVIRKVVKTASDELLTCFTTELVATPALQGTVQVQFIIAQDGSTKTPAATGVSQAVANCVAGVIGRLKFPSPKGGGIVQVNYPFTFHHGG